MQRVFYDILIIAAIVTVIIYVYQNFQQQILVYLFGEQPVTMYVESTPVSVRVADTDEKRTQGLSGLPSLGEFEGMLFIFDKEDYYGMWMKDMEFPLDIFWINNDSEIVHIEKVVEPTTYPQSFGPPVPARFVLELNAYFADSANIVVGDKVVLPPAAIPDDLIYILQ